MGFKDKFKMGDVICSDHFYNGKLMIVKEGHSRYFDGFCYVCDDMFINNQQWCAYEMMSGYSYREHSYEWRIATDDDYYKNILNWMDTKVTLSNLTDIIITDQSIYLPDTVILNPTEAMELKEIIEKYVTY